ncbi:RhuM family protein [Ravibacter arvi]|uniref:RhuM family protein n=1 Tax=Ravibacter arvi TaxID=2051041 RepID=A0ABP8M4L0_9BACT
MDKQIEIYQSGDGQLNIEVRFEQDTVWLDAHAMSAIFDVQRPAVVKHIGNIYKSGELIAEATCSISEQVASDGKKRKMNLYNLDMIISVGYRVNSPKATQFRQWATGRLKDFLVKGYAINEKRLAQKQLEIQTLKEGIRILSRAIESQSTTGELNWLNQYAIGLELLDDYDHERLDERGLTKRETIYPALKQYFAVIESMKADFESPIFGKEKDQGFQSAIAQIAKGFEGEDFYPSIEEKAATLLYLVVKNHAFADGNKRIAAACFLLFLNANDGLYGKGGHALVSNEALASLTLFIASSKPEEMETVKKLIISVLNRNQRSWWLASE